MIVEFEILWEKTLQKQYLADKLIMNLFICFMDGIEEKNVSSFNNPVNLLHKNAGSRMLFITQSWSQNWNNFIFTNMRLL